MSSSQIERFTINEWDWEHAKRYCRRYLEKNESSGDRDDACAYSTAIIVTYSRPFGVNHDRTQKKERSDKRLVEALDADHKTVHSHVVDLRNQLFAHSDASPHNVVLESSEEAGLGVFSQDRITPLDRVEVEVLLENIAIFVRVNERLKNDAIATHLSGRKDDFFGG